MSPKAPIIAGQAAFIPYTTDSTHSTSDWIGVYEVGAVDYADYAYVTEGPTGETKSIEITIDLRVLNFVC